MCKIRYIFEGFRGKFILKYRQDDLKPIKSDSGSRHPEAGRLPTKPARLSREAKIYLCPESSGLISAFIRLPLETLGEILCSLPTPKDLLAVARTCKTLCKILIHPDAAYIWRRLRNKVGLPDPLKFNSELSSETNEVLGWVEGIGLFVRKESAYAAFVFDGGVCEVRLAYVIRGIRLIRLDTALRKGYGRNVCVVFFEGTLMSESE